MNTGSTFLENLLNKTMLCNYTAVSVIIFFFYFDQVMSIHMNSNIIIESIVKLHVSVR